MKPTIVHVIGTLAVGGAERVLIRLCRLTRDRCNHRVITLLDVPDSASELIQIGIPVDRLKPARLGGVVQGLRRAYRLREGEFLLHGWTYPGCVAATALRLIACSHATLIWDVRNSLGTRQTHTWRGRSSLALTGLLSRNPDVVTFNSVAGRTVHLSQGWQPKQHKVIHNPIMSPSLAEAAMIGRSFRREMGLDVATPVVAVVGRDAKNKRLDIAVEAIRLASSQVPAMVGLHAGRLGGNASLLCRAGRLRPLGELSDTRPLIAAADVLLVSSDVEGFPNVVAESVLLGTPVVSTDVGDASRIVGDFGRICSPGDASALAEALVHVVQSRLKLNAAKATAAARRVAAMCDPATIAEQYMRIWGGGELVCDETSVR